MNPIITKLKNDSCPYKQIRKFSDEPGIYAFFFTGNDFPLSYYNPQKDEIIYIGKTESSHASRDEKTHFASGKTGSSTIRRSLGALLKNELSLNPIPRNGKDFDAGRKSFFKFDEPSEEKLTTWMKDNLGLSFYEYDQPPSEIDVLETELIAEVKPLLNIDSKNPDNPYAQLIRAARKACANVANQAMETKDTFYIPNNNQIITLNAKPMSSSQNIHKYEDIFKNALTQIGKAIDESAKEKQSVQLDEDDFKHVSGRKSFSFNLEFKNGVVANNIGGSAVARDLARVLEQNIRIMQKLKGKHIKSNLDKGFTLWISQ
ncbi:MAG: hypothetical protein WCO02_04880 [Bacteroidota bacterium]